MNTTYTVRQGICLSEIEQMEQYFGEDTVSEYVDNFLSDDRIPAVEMALVMRAWDEVTEAKWRLQEARAERTTHVRMWDAEWAALSRFMMTTSRDADMAFRAVYCKDDRYMVDLFANCSAHQSTTVRQVVKTYLMGEDEWNTPGVSIGIVSPQADEPERGITVIVAPSDTSGSYVRHDYYATSVHEDGKKEEATVDDIRRVEWLFKL